GATSPCAKRSVRALKIDVPLYPHVGLEVVGNNHTDKCSWLADTAGQVGPAIDRHGVQQKLRIYPPLQPCMYPFGACSHLLDTRYVIPNGPATWRQRGILSCLYGYQVYYSAATSSQ